MSERTLLVGLDLNDEYSQICYFDEKTFEPVCLGMDEQEASQYVPTFLVVKEDTQECLIGKEAVLAVKEGKGERVDHILQRIMGKAPFLVYGREIPPVKVMRRFLSKLLNILKQYHPTKSILKLVVTVETPDVALMEVIYGALAELGVEKDRAVVIGHKQSFLYYVLVQKKEIWCSDVGMFEWNSNRLQYYQITMDRRKKPMIIGITEKDYSEAIPNDWHKKLDEDAEGMAYLFENIVNGVLHKQIVSTLYMIGKGFEGNWSDPALRRLCVGRRVFKGMNLYVKGACYAARELSGKGRLEEFIFLDEHMLPCHIYTNMYSESKNKEIILVKAGTPWFEVEGSVDFIPDGEDEIHLFVRNVVTKEVAKHIIPLEMVRLRPNRMSRVHMRIRFEDSRTCILTIKDRGFGDIYKTSNRVWEKMIQV